MDVKQIFVFVVCGADEHIHTLNYALKHLKHFSKKEILVVTDLSRNTTEIEHETILNISTPEEFNHHQASIYLKTGLHKFLKPGNHYCYLDTDIIAIRDGVDAVFEHYQAPITFCSDHCRLRKFSLSAVYSEDDEIKREKEQELTKQMNKFRAIEEEQLKKVGPEYSRIIELKAEWGAFLETFANSFSREKELVDLQEHYYNIVRPANLPAKLTLGQFLLKLLARIRHLCAMKPKQFSNIFSQILYFPLFLFAQLVYFFYKPICRFFYQYNPETEEWVNRKGELVYKVKTNFLNYFSNRNFIFNPFNKRWYDRNQDILFEQEFDYQRFFNKQGFRYDAKTKKWYTLEGDRYIYSENYVVEQVEANTEFTWDISEQKWQFENGEFASFTNESDKLVERIKEKFDIEITEANWQHWNGGVFLFTDESKDFLENWHNWTMEIFKDDKWKTRDQGTLVATCWKFNLKNHPVLPMIFNFIADYYHPSMQYKGDLIFDLNTKITNIKPALLHVYHHFGDKEWKVWQDVEHVLGIPYNYE